MITLMKASAGSGKTYALAHKYIRLLRAASDLQEYRHILAVTFTNKATGEMKDRIIKELAKSENLRDKVFLYSILHDYGSFAVSTIDRFFQQTLRAFARELGQFNSYQVELDKDALVDEAVDTILDELNQDSPEDRQMIEFIVNQMVDRLNEGLRLDVETDLKEMARQLKSETFSRKCTEIGMDRNTAYSSEELLKLKNACKTIIDDFITDVHSRAKDVKDALIGAGYVYTDFSRSWMDFIEKFTSWDYKEHKSPSVSVTGKIKDASADKWFNKKDLSKFPDAYSALGPALDKFMDLWSGRFRTFNTAVLLLDQVYGLSVAARLFNTFDRITKEKNVVCLDESNSLLRDIIDGSDTPFVYEKTGVRFNTFLLDEFQDTSLTQWNNFKPLLDESESRKESVTTPEDAGRELKDELHRNDNLIVGDVKQSIYRWRESDWGLLDHQVAEDFAGHTFNDPLDCNWRSLKNIVDFNNELYPYLAAAIDTMNVTPSGMHTVSQIYSGCHQKPGHGAEQAGGCVDVRFTEDDQQQLDAITETIRDLKEHHGANYGDVAVLVRTKTVGTQVAQRLIDEHIPVVTDASLKIKNSISVRRLVSMMSYVDNPQNEVGTFIAQKYNMASLPSSYHSLPDLAELMYKTLCTDDQCRMDCEKEVMYVTSFMDCVMDYSNANGSNLREFLAWWENNDSNVNSTESEGAVRIVTIHKSKGLSYPYVILPFVDDIKLFDSRHTFVWTQPEKGNDILDRFCDRLFYVKLTKDSVNTAFSSCYEQEKFNQGIDALNILYVATTRAEKGLLITANRNTQGFSGSIAFMLQNFCVTKNSAGKSSDFHLGELPDFSVKKDANDEKEEEIVLKYPFYDIAKRLAIRPYASDFFTDEDSSYEHLSHRERGIVLHDILSRVSKPDDLDASVDQAVADGSLSADSREKVKSFLRKRICAHNDFFPTDGKVTLQNETTIIAADGTEHRPDRVLIHPDGSVLIVDYKFAAPHEDYDSQIAQYRDLYVAMGYKTVRAALWYVYKDQVIYK